MISIIAAIAKNGVIGKENKLPWNLPTDLQRFRTLTLYQSVIMGRKTFESLSGPLKDRMNIVVTRTWTTGLDKGCLASSSLEKALKTAQIVSRSCPVKEIFIIGGAQLFAEALPLADKMYLTLIDQEVDGDVYFPAYDKNIWAEVDRSSAIEENGYSYEWVTFLKKN